MQIANVRVRLDKLGSDVPKNNVTPAEALVLHVIHQQTNGGSTFGEDMDKIVVTGEAKELEKVIPAYTIPAQEIPAVIEPSQGVVGDEHYVPEKVITPAKTIPAKDIPEEKVYRPRTNVEEMNRLRRLYGTLTNKKGEKILTIIFPDRMNPKLPEKFSDLHWKEIQYDGAELGSFDYGTSNGAAITQ